MAITGRSALVMGSASGLVLAATVVLTGSLEIGLFTPTPLWQRVLLFPGFVAGYQFYDLSLSGNWFSDSSSAESIATWVGVLAVGAAYGAVAVALRAIAIRLSRGPRAA